MSLARRHLLAAGAAAIAFPASAKPSVPRLGLIADCQYADENDNGQRLYRLAPGKLKAAVEDFNARGVDAIVQLGDFIDKDWRSFDALQPMVDAAHAPWRFVLGNHDFSVDDAFKTRLAQRLKMPGRYYAFDLGDWTFLALDGNDLSEYGWPHGSAELAESQRLHHDLYAGKPDWDGGVGPTQMAWIDQRLTAADRAGRKVALFCHFSVWPVNPHNLWNAPEVVALLERHSSVKAWINGHNHDGDQGFKAGIHYLNLKAMLDTTQTSYVVASFHADRIEIAGVGRQASQTLPLGDTPRPR
ncbi:MAG: metallophosphoesterase [Caulobacter sp.]|nr:metallophosphoesterase [Caulobacter sp.]